MRRSVWFWGFLLSLPTLVSGILGLYFYVKHVPILMANEETRIEASYGQLAENLQDEVEKPDFIWEYGKGITSGDFARYGEAFSSNRTWRAWMDGKEAHGARWGRCAGPDGDVIVWIRTGKKLLAGKSVPLETVTRYDYMFRLALPGGFLLLVFFTGFGLRYFVSYMRARDDYLSATAHDLTTPLVGLRYLIGHDDDEARVLVERLLRLVENIKDFLRLGGRRRPKGEVFDLLAAYRVAYRLFQEEYRDLFDGADVAIEPTDASAQTWSVFADETMCVQIIWNLLGNDLKYAAPYGRVRVALVRSAREVQMRFIDDGPGMSATERRRAFNRYYRAKTVLQSGKGGFGIGLCAAREFARMMGGDLTLTANQPKGCVFTLSLPCASSIAPQPCP